MALIADIRDGMRNAESQNGKSQGPTLAFKPIPSSVILGLDPRIHGWGTRLSQQERKQSSQATRGQPAITFSASLAVDPRVEPEDDDLGDVWR